jgi:hypothetical protein
MEKAGKEVLTTCTIWKTWETGFKVFLSQAVERALMQAWLKQFLRNWCCLKHHWQQLKEVLAAQWVFESSIAQGLLCMSENKTLNFISLVLYPQMHPLPIFTTALKQASFKSISYQTKDAE